MNSAKNDHIVIGVTYLIAAVLAMALLVWWGLKGHQAEVATQQPTPHHRPEPEPTVPTFQFPQGGRELSGKYCLIALYGVTDSNVLGALGDQPLPQSIERIKQIAADYQPFSTQKVYPTFEIIATVASAGPTDNGDYSREADAAQLKPWIDAARNAGVYVVLDLQPGRTDFLTQAKMYESLLREPHVGLALDPEWRLGPNQVHLQQIGSVGVDEVNATSQWLSELTIRYTLPQKLFLIHQFRSDMIAGRERLGTHPELMTVFQMDGQGTQPAKSDTWATMTATPPPGTSFGWKNFYDEDQPMLSPESTMNRQPVPVYVSYQ